MCGGGSEPGGDNEDSLSGFEGENMGLSDQEVSDATSDAYNSDTRDDTADRVGIDAFGGKGGASSSQSTAGSQSSAGDMAGGSMSVTDPTTGQTTTYSPTQVPDLELMGKIGFDPFNMRDKVNNIISKRDAMHNYTQVTRDDKGNITGAFDNAPAFGLNFMPNVTTYTGIDQNPYNEDMNYMDSESDSQQIIRRNPSDPVQDDPTDPNDPILSDELASDYLQNPYYLYSGIGNQYQPYGYAQNTLVDLLRTRNMTQPQQRAANLGLFGNPGDFS